VFSTTAAPAVPQESEGSPFVLTLHNITAAANAGAASTQAASAVATNHSCSYGAGSGCFQPTVPVPVRHAVCFQPTVPVPAS
jgi:hypothetical protein